MMMQNSQGTVKRRKRKTNQYRDPYQNQYRDPYQNQYRAPYQQSAYMNPRNQGRLDVAGAWILMEGYHALTTKGKRRVVPLLGLALVTVGTMKVAKWSGRTLAKGIRSTRNYLARGKTDVGYNQPDEQQPIQSQQPTPTQPVQQTQQPIRQEVDMTGSDVQPKPFTHKLYERLLAEEGVFFRLQANDKKPTKDKDGTINPNYATQVKIGLDNGDFILVESNGLYDKQGNLLITGGALETATSLLNKYNSKYERGLLVIVDEFIKEGKIA